MAVTSWGSCEEVNQQQDRRPETQDTEIILYASALQFREDLPAQANAFTTGVEATVDEEPIAHSAKDQRDDRREEGDQVEKTVNRDFVEQPAKHGAGRGDSKHGCLVKLVDVPLVIEEREQSSQPSGQ